MHYLELFQITTKQIQSGTAEGSGKEKIVLKARIKRADFRSRLHFGGRARTYQGKMFQKGAVMRQARGTNPTASISLV